ncbi:MAG TPA: RDD family protein [Candidatus Dormibacteraeota bacterium]|nr:RDD family protein [Candidatus Dormibacteraeota bacterium]
MDRPLPDTDLVVATPERVSFDYQVAGLGTRAIAQLVDLLVLVALLIALGLVALAISAAGLNTVATLVMLIGAFVAIFGYFWISEALWSGQTIGKRVFRLRAVGDRGEPMTFLQAGIRNVVRIVDFLPYGYGVGLVTLFINGKGKRLGDLAAGTIVVKDSDYLWLWQLPGGRPPAPSPGQPEQPGAPPPIAPPPPPPPPPPAFAPASPAELFLRRLDPDVRRFVTAYARRRHELPVALRAQLAQQVDAKLQSAAPDVYQQHGPLAALDYLADLEGQ